LVFPPSHPASPRPGSIRPAQLTNVAFRTISLSSQQPFWQMQK
jgi:hypothetical protein